ncbi:MAG: NAD-binding protein, partial [Pseudomonadota bacterium]
MPGFWMRAAGHDVTVIDFSSAQLEMIAKFGLKAYFGDATRPDLLHSAGLGEAKLFVIAIDGKEQITELVRYTVKNYPNVHIVARAVDRGHV